MRKCARGAVAVLAASLLALTSAAEQQHVVVTGGLGFIGSHVVEALLTKGFKVTIFDDMSNGHNHNGRANEVVGDVSVATDVEKLSAHLPVDYVVHLAAAISVTESVLDPDKYRRVNVEGSRLVFEWARTHGVKRVVSASSAAIYGNPSTLPISEDYPYGGVSPYAESKWQMEKVQEEMAKHGLDSIALRFFNVFGPRQDPGSPYSGVISKFFDRARSSQPLVIFGDGYQTRDFVYVGDVANAVVLALNSHLSGFHAINISQNRETSVNHLAAEVLVKFGATSLGVRYEPAREGDVRFSRGDNSLAEELLGFGPQTSLGLGLDWTKRWFVASEGKDEL